MKTNTRFWFSPLLLGLVFAILALGGCSGDDGAPGAAGADGTDGADGADAVILADIVPINPVLDLSNTVDYNPVSGAVTIHFFFKDEDGNGIDITTDAYELRIYAAELLPGEAPLPNDDPANTTGQGDAWNPLWNERGTPAAGSLPGTLTLVDAATGEYTYVCDNTLPASNNVQRIIVTARWRETIGGVRYVFANAANASYDFLQSDPATELTSSGADMVSTAACETCHGARIGDVGHGGGYTKVKTCNNCHNVNYMGSRNDGEGDLAFMIHRIHNAGDFLKLDHGGPISFAHVTYPQEINTCTKCHTSSAPDANLHYDVPTRANCGSCHANVNVNFADPATTHGGGQQLNDSRCAVCHVPGPPVGPSGLVNTIAAHNPAPILANTPEYAVTISMTPPANGSYYVAGESPLVTVTLASNDTPPVPVDYQAVPEEGTTDGALASANLYIYGPRADAVPVLATDTIHDPGYVAPPTQGHSLLSTSSDPLATPTPGGYTYQLLTIPPGMEPGTYMVRFEGEDYGVPDAGPPVDYRTASSAVINFQVGTATEEHKLSGDACTNCHGDTIMHLEGAHPHHQPFDTDGCLGCHDKSGNYGDYIGNRVHAVHSASVTGDLKHRDWSHVTFPQEPNNCTICHTDTTTDTPVWRNPNEVACGGCHGTDPLADPDLYPPELASKIISEAAAAVHMTNEGGTFNVTTLDVPRACIVCHGEGKIADLYETHELVTFPPPVVPEP